MPTPLFDRRQGKPAVSHEFVGRLLRFVSFEPGWDGEKAEPISSRTAEKAYELAAKSLSFTKEPFVAPADGSLLLRWHLPSGEVVELFVDEDEVDSLALIHNHEVRDIPAHDDESVLAFLRSLAGGGVGAGLRR